MCPRLLWNKVRPGDLVWCCLQAGAKLYLTDDAGESNPDKEIVCTVPFHQPCLMISFAGDDKGIIMVLGPHGRFGWTHRLFWERAGEEKPEHEYADGDQPR